MLTYDVACTSLSEVALYRPAIHCTLHQHTAHALHKLSAPNNLMRLLTKIAYSMTGTNIYTATPIGHHFFPLMMVPGIVIGSTVIIGDHVSIYHEATLGVVSFPVDQEIGKKIRSLPRHLIIMGRVVLYANAPVLVRIRTGEDGVIGANFGVVKSLSTPLSSPSLHALSREKLLAPGMALLMGRLGIWQ
ncbi:putative serine acetyltransferase [Trypanosoma rangeli]|uniref:Putative serine acetyltransferase n=1 Tax=Trypanosoma rangeli TaxID=5698 RepID=A0A422NRX3_TRYRA|nr:putative serine acetyltransferase [Trypanosoma rangeli]RNF08235.1 putative serine acetyltransferase [Trypanosoma rangeli]|eukprot:RNF08235.1 putative serine acetyltransferase [Trypanosoma rangeli]